MRFWFEPAEPLNLGVCRALFFGAFFLLYLGTDWSAWGDVSTTFWMPISFFKALSLSALSADSLAVIEGIWKVSLALSSLGFLTRTNTIVSFVFGAYLVGLPHNFGTLHHYNGLVVVVLGIMAASRCGDGFSIDRLLRARRGAPPAQPSGNYTWPVRAVWLMFALVFFAAGMSKLKHAGLEWVFSENMAVILMRAQYVHIPLVSWGTYLAQYELLPRLMAASTVALEISYPLALFSRRARWVIVPAVFVMLVTIRLLMGPPFYPFLICHLFWVPWDRVGRALIGTKMQTLASLRW
jgi:hypothetical protein